MNVWRILGQSGLASTAFASCCPAPTPLVPVPANRHSAPVSSIAPPVVPAASPTIKATAEKLPVSVAAEAATKAAPTAKSPAIVAPALPEVFVADGNLAEWDHAHGKDGDWLALVFTPEGVVVAGELSTERAVVELTLPSMPLPRVGTAFERAGALAEYSCVRKLWTGEPLTPPQSQACFAELRKDAAYRDRYTAIFVKSYVLDQFCLRSPGSESSLPSMEGRAGRCTSEAGKLTFETTLAARALPRLGMCASLEVGVRLRGLANGAEPSVLLRLPKPWSFGSDARLWPVLCEQFAQPWENFMRAFSYQPGQDGLVSANGHRYIGKPRDTLDWIDRDPTQLVTKQLKLPKQGVRLGRVELRVLPPELGLIVVYVDQSPTNVIGHGGDPHLFVRDGELQVIESFEGMDDASLRPAVKWRFERVRSDGTVLDGQSYETLSLGLMERAYHDATYSLIGARHIPSARASSEGLTVVEWRYSSKDRQYELVPTQ